MEQFTNGPTTGLDGAIDDSVTSLTVTASTNFPSSPNYRIRIDSEIMLVTAGAGTLTWTVTRGADGTTAASHIDGSTVTHVLTADAVAEFRIDNCLADTYANRPSPGKEGRIFIPTDSRQQVIQRDNGATWDSYGPYQIYTAPPASGTLTWVNQGSTTVTDDTSILMLATNHATNRHLLAKTMGSAPWTLRIACKGFGYPSSKYGLMLRQSGTGELYGWGPIINSTQAPVLSAKYSAAATGGSNAPDFQATNALVDIVWLGLGWDGTNANCWFSEDGEHWVLMHQEDLTALMTPDQVGIFVEEVNGSTLDTYMRVFSWEEL